MLDKTPARWLQVVFTIVLLSAVSFKLRVAIFDPDTWWHLKVGQWVTNHGTVPEVDPFSRMSQENPKPWLAYSWLFELLLWHVNVYGLRFTFAYFSAIAIFLYMQYHIGRTYRGMIYQLATTLVLMTLTAERPWHFTIFFSVVTLHCVQQIRAGERCRQYWYLPLIFVLWANIHIQFVLGWGFLGLLCLLPGAAKRKEAILLSVACFAAVLFNPYHAKLLLVVWEYATQAQALRLVNELQPPSLLNPILWIILLCNALTIYDMKSRNQLELFHILLIGMGLFFTLRMQRDMWLGVLCCSFVHKNIIPIVLEYKYYEVTTGPAFRVRYDRWYLFPLGLALVFYLGYLDTSPHPKHKEFIDDGYPWLAANYVKKTNPPGPIFNTFDWGGFMIYNLPQYPVSIDGRTNLYGNERLLRNYKTMLAEPGWEQDPDLVQANLVFIPRNIPLTDALFLKADVWELAHQDDTAVVFVRKK